MRPVTPDRWQRWLGEMPIPEDATEDMMWAAYGSIQEMERRDEAIDGITFYSDLVEREKKRLRVELELGESEKTEMLRDIIKTGKQIVNTYRSWLQ